jgi:hypothetical protein
MVVFSLVVLVVVFSLVVPEAAVSRGGRLL